ncbi:hypothetical protein DK28_0213900 [Peptococcaceae bacterium SCADC1_2_3]|nr:hypothetical protein DK28_0213900 [Peptococcaceae bacterium SCADC1_2_3]KFI34979.1 hypothetical protein HY00_08135 [Peptococcaceae bacterium SCADC1_2_3]
MTSLRFAVNNLPFSLYTSFTQLRVKSIAPSSTLTYFPPLKYFFLLPLPPPFKFWAVYNQPPLGSCFFYFYLVTHYTKKCLFLVKKL